ncbi:MAG: tetratricopeptide repeat protein, partial [Thermoguttaceae bacterium]|nr:tetratricopeptide repeat protein [Thermoguttaceae bacterium]
MRAINLRLLLIAVVVLLVVGGGVHLLHSFQVQRNADFFLDQAEKAAKAAKLGEQAQNLQWYLKLVPDDVDATSQLGLVLADLGAYRPAYDTLEKALRLDPANTVARRKQVLVAIGLGRYSDARDHLLDERLLNQTLTESELLLQMGRCQEALGKYASADNAKLTPDISSEVARDIPAAVWYEAAIASAPDQLQAYVGLAGLLRNRLNQKEAADEWMKKLVEANPESAEAHVYYGQYLLGEAKDTPQAEAEARRALELEPDLVGGLLLAAQCAIEQQRYDEARTHAARALELEPRQATLYATLADIETRSGQSAAAIAWLEKGLEANSGNPDILWQLTRLLIEAGELERAESRLAELEKTSRTPALVEFLRARKTLAQEQWLAASRQFEQVRANLTPWPSIVKEVDFYLGECYRQLGNSDQQLTAYRRALSADPFWLPARAGLAEALRSMGRIDEALEEFRQIMKLGKAPAAGWIDLAQLTLLDQLRRKRAERNWSEVDDLIDRAEQANPEAPNVAILRAEALVARDQIDSARKLLQEAETRHPTSIELRLARVSLAQQERQWDEAESLLNDAQKQLGDSVSLRLGWAQHWLRKLGSEAKPRIQELAANSDALPKNDLPRLWEGLAVASLRTGDFEQTRQLCRKISVELPNRLRIWLTLFDLAIRANDDSDLADVVSEIHRIEGGGPLWQYARALQLVLKWNELERDSADASKRQQADADLREAMDHLASAATARPAWSLLYLLTARIHELRSQPDMALEAYTRAIDLGSREPQAIRRAIGLLYERQRYSEAYALIQRLSEQQTPFSADLARLASDVSLRLDDFDRALELARNNARDSTNYLDHVWLGQVLTVMGMAAQQQSAEGKTFLDEAEQSFRQAITLKVDAPDAWVALILFFGQTGDTEKAEAAIVEAQQKIPQGIAPLALAQCYEAMGRMEDAEKSYQQALAADPEGGVTARKVAEFYLKTGKSQPAEEQLQRIAEGKVKVEEADQVWARRALALVLAGRGGFGNLKDGLNLVEENLNRKQIAPEDQRVKAILLSSHPKRAEREEAIRVLEDLLDKQPKALPDDRFILARLYLTQGDWANGSRHMRTLLASAGNDAKFPLYVATYIRFLLDRREIGEAELWLTRL